jgi:small basic protein
MQQTSTDYYSALVAVPIVAAVSGISGALPAGGDCPTTQFSVFGKSYTIDVQCQLWAQYVGPIMGIVMLAFWTILGIRIAFSA